MTMIKSDVYIAKMVMTYISQLFVNHKNITHSSVVGGGGGGGWRGGEKEKKAFGSDHKSQ